MNKPAAFKLKKISILTPTRGRPGEALNMAQSILVKAQEIDNVKIWFWIDEDDPKIEDYIMNLKQGPYSDWIIIVEGKRQPLGKCWNELAKHHLQEADIFMMGNDDWVMGTNNWDTVIQKEVRNFVDDIYVLYPHDSNDGKCTFPIVSNQWVTTLGYLYPEIFEFLANDTYTAMLGEAIGRLKKIDVTLDHKHFAFGKSKYDDTYRYHRDKGSTKRDVELLNRSQDLIQSDADKLKKLMK
jgi:glycosyl transferase/beta-hydroxylase protein BlmF